jgi:hypothetical protein
MSSLENSTRFGTITQFIRQNQKNLTLLILTLSLFLFYKSIFVITLFFVLDFIVSYVDHKYKIDLMFDVNPLGLIVFSYAFNYKYGVFFAFMMLIPRIILGKIEKRHLVKVPILIAIAFFADIFSFVDIAILGVLLFIVRYIMEYAFDFALTGAFSSSRMIRRIGHLAGAYIFFTMLAAPLVIFLSS